MFRGLFLVPPIRSVLEVLPEPFVRSLSFCGSELLVKDSAGMRFDDDWSERLNDHVFARDSSFLNGVPVFSMN